MSEHVTVTRHPASDRPPLSDDPGPGLGLIVGVLLTVLVVLLLAWLFWIQPSYFPQVQIIAIPQETQPQPVQPDVNIQGGTGGTGQGGTGGTSGGATGGSGGSGVAPQPEPVPEGQQDTSTTTP